MDSNALLDKNSVRVLYILEQSKEINKMIDLDKSQSDDNFMVNQYQDMKNRFLEELKIILDGYEIEVLIKNKKNTKPTFSHCVLCVSAVPSSFLVFSMFSQNTSSFRRIKKSNFMNIMSLEL